METIDIEFDFTPGIVPFLDDWVVDGQIEMPLSALLEMVIASCDWSPENCFFLKDVSFHFSLIRGSGRKVHLQISTKSNRFNIVSRSLHNPTDHGLRHLSGSLEYDKTIDVFPDLSISHLNNDRYLKFDRISFYSNLEDAGISFKPTYQVIDDLFLSCDRSFARVELPDSLSTDLDLFTFHPVLLGAPFQVIALMSQYWDSSAHQYFDFFHFSSILKLKVLKKCHKAALIEIAHLSPSSRRSDSLHFDVFFRDLRGDPIACFSDVCFRSNYQSLSIEEDPKVSREAVIRLINEIVLLDGLSEDTNLYSLGVTSLELIRIVNALESKYGSRIDIEEFFNSPTVSTIENLYLSNTAYLSPNISNLLEFNDSESLNHEYPLSFMQEQFWFLEQLDNINRAYNEPIAYRFKGEIDHASLEQSINALISRHESLRTVFKEFKGVLTQIVKPFSPIVLPIFELENNSVDILEDKAHDVITDIVKRPFNLVEGPLIRFNLVRLRSDDHLLVIVVHHIICDEWSFNDIALHDLRLSYKAFHEGIHLDLPPLLVQYGTYVKWERKTLDALSVDNLRWWKSHLDGVSYVLDLPTDYGRPPVQTHVGDRYFFSISSTSIGSVFDFARNRNTTIFTVFLSAFSILIMRYTGAVDFLIGTPVFNRKHHYLESIIGCFINILPIRADLRGSPDFLSCVQRMHRVVANSLAHQDIPFTSLIKNLYISRYNNRNPLVQTLFIYRTINKDSDFYQGIDVSYFNAKPKTSKFDLTLELYTDGTSINGFIEYDTSLFAPETIEYMSIHYCNIIKEALSSPITPVERLPLLSSIEHATQICKWNDTQTKSGQFYRIDQMVEDTARSAAQSPAVGFGGNILSYREIVDRTDHFARYLLMRGVVPNTRIGVLLERCIDLPIVLLAISKVGAVFVPLDPRNPPRRNLIILEDSAVDFIVSQNELVKEIEAHDINKIFLCDMSSSVALPPYTPSHVGPNGTAYIIFTSGSTGRPKGVEITHRSLTNLLVSMKKKPGFAPNDRLLSITTPGFDIALLELFLPLISGGYVEIADAQSTNDPLLLIDLIQTSNPSVMQATPATWHMLFEAGWSGKKDLTAFCGGEALSFQLAQKLIAFCGSVWNLYGPTETTIWSTINNVILPEDHSCIGRPINNTYVYVLDNLLQPVPVGVIGELYIGGDGLAKGYFERPDLTSRSFQSNPFRITNRQRIYKTGDLVKFLKNGKLQYFGRSDHQVKQRGIRIEPGEIEGVMEQLPEIERCIVVQPQTGYSDSRLVAFVTCSKNVPPIAERLVEQHFDQWASVWESTYSNSSTDNFSFDVIGWNNSYTGNFFSEAEMKNHVDTAISRILYTKPSRVLEIGCGSGLLLFRIAPLVSYYEGSDFSFSCLQRINDQLDGRLSPRVALKRKLADDFADVRESNFDVVILNSVIQYFPSIEYLEKVLFQAIKAARPGGSVFVGDVRNMRDLELFHTSVEVHKSTSDTTVQQIRTRIEKAVYQENELVVDPAFFYKLISKEPKLEYVEVLIKEGSFVNELTKYRYDVLLHTKSKQTETESRRVDFIDWQNQNLTVRQLEDMLSRDKPNIAVITRIPNYRLNYDREIAKLLRDDQCPRTAGELKELALSAIGEISSYEEIWSLSKRTPYLIRPMYSRDSTSYCFDMLTFHKDLSRKIVGSTCAAIARNNSRSDGRRTSANNPLSRLYERELIKKWRDDLATSLPKHMIPSAFIVLDNFPINENGKIDRARLFTYTASYHEQHDASSRPETRIERIISDIWSEILGMECRDVHDDFFQIGGHSLLLVGVASTIKEKFGYSISIQSLIQNSTIKSLAAHIDKAIINQSNRSADRDAGESRPNGLLVKLRNGNDDSPAVFIVHSLSGSVLGYQDLVSELKTERSIWGIQSGGIRDGQVPRCRVEDMATTYIEAIRDVQSEGPYFLLGHSMGGIIALEIAQQLKNSGQKVAMICLIDSYLGNEYPRALSEGERMVLLLGNQMDIEIHRFLNMSFEEQIRYTTDILFRSNTGKKDDSVKQCLKMIEIAKANENALRDYSPKLYLDPIVYIKAKDRFQGFPMDDNTDRLTAVSTKIDSLVVNGDHFSMLRPPHAAEISTHLMNYLMLSNAYN